MMTVALETAGLGRRYGRKWGLRDCSMSVGEGTITGLVGPNGAGKSTLLRLAVGLSRPSTGAVAVFGEPVRPSGVAHLQRLGYLDQLRPFYPGFRVSEMLQMGKRLNARWEDAVVRTWLTDLGIDPTARVGRLSLGQQAEVAIALSLGKQADLLLLDEPVAALDPLARHRLLQALMGTVAEHGTTVLMTSHILSELETVCDHLVVLAASEVLLAGAVDTIVGDHRILVGPRSTPRPSGLTVVSSSFTERQQTLLARGASPDPVPGWDVAEPSLEEIVLAYLSRQPDEQSGPRLQGGER
jgi:ABC-2 type transport system ATP-binding protein